jgi:four helix bundle protein
MQNIYKNLNVYQQAKTIAETIVMLVDSFDTENIKDLTKQLIYYSKKLPENIISAECGEYYSLRLENAFSVKKAARELQSLLLLCESMQLTHNDYIHFIIKELEVFRGLFLRWVAGFDKQHDYQDEWFFEV